MPLSEWEKLKSKDALSSIGLYQGEESPFIDQAIDSSDRIPFYKTIDRRRKLSGLISRSLYNVSGKLLGIRRTVEILARTRSNPNHSVQDTLSLVKSEEGPAHGPYCLQRSLRRWHLLCQNGYAPTLTVGVQVPTERMHIWVSINENHIGEDPDEVTYYTPSCQFQYVA